MSSEDLKAFIRQYIDDVNHHQDLDAIDRYVAGDVVNHAAMPSLRQGITGYKQIVAGSVAAMPDQRWDIENIVAEGDLVVVHGRRRATWLAPISEACRSPRTKLVEVEYAHIFRVVDDLITEHWAVRDDLGILLQLSAITQSESNGA
ncbi:MAG: ester cyclase [Chloroflexota bacterium]|nr:ester cyclase [Chloroflexota bacterium]